MRLLCAATVIVTAAAALAACGTQDSPERAAEEWLEAFANMDGNKLMERTCAEQQRNAQETGVWLSAFALLVQSLTRQQTEIDISDVGFDVIEEAGDRARVRVTGQIRTAVLAIGRIQEIDEVWLIVREDGQWKWCGN